MSHAVGEVQSMSCREILTHPPNVFFRNSMGSIFIGWDTIAVFSAACAPAIVCWVMCGRENFVPEIPVIDLGPSDVISGRDASIVLSTGPTTGTGRMPGVSVV